jgi:hypothetical protein
MIEHAPKKESSAVRPKRSSEDDLLDEGLQETFPASDPPTAVQPHPHHRTDQRPVWDQRPETD